MFECLFCLFRLYWVKGGVGVCRGGCSLFGGFLVGSILWGCGLSFN